VLAARTLAPETLAEARLAGALEGDTLCFPMLAGGVAVAVLGVRPGATLTAEQRRSLGAAAALIAIAVRNVQLFLETREQSLRDDLTGCFNRGHGLDTLDRELRRSRRLRQPLSIVMFDIDHFKTINDELGHLRGDDLLRAVGAQLTRVLRSTDIRCRCGGDEFMVILPDTPGLGARQVAESLRRELMTLAMVANGKTIAVTASLGIATASHSDLGITGLIERADRAMYQAKHLGRNRFCVDEDPPAPSPIAVPGLPA
jgi:diguanylate cyclase (GGDEF)-like protein